MASRPPGRSTRAISRERGRRIRNQLQHGHRDHRVDGVVAQRKSLCVGPQEADVRSRFVADGACQHRLGDVDAQGQSVLARRRGPATR